MITSCNSSRLDEVQSENMKMKVENNKLVRKVETIKNENKCIEDSFVSDTSFWEKRIETQIEHQGKILDS